MSPPGVFTVPVGAGNAFCDPVGGFGAALPLGLIEGSPVGGKGRPRPVGGGFGVIDVKVSEGSGVGTGSGVRMSTEDADFVVPDGHAIAVATPAAAIPTAAAIATIRVREAGASAGEDATGARWMGTPRAVCVTSVAPRTLTGCIGVVGNTSVGNA